MLTKQLVSRTKLFILGTLLLLSLLTMVLGSSQPAASISADFTVPTPTVPSGDGWTNPIGG
ncbi:hypothetical protein MNBD_CHLOROFLEXI01-5178 [hydrothermal vent metagenome]|uniref:Uncharacterized protein n=1 Tax=hydrothermal vent metagenome TaxID=652676 RepID=A0A3B0VFV4_9ZZZZ